MKMDNLFFPFWKSSCQKCSKSMCDIALGIVRLYAQGRDTKEVAVIFLRNTYILHLFDNCQICGMHFMWLWGFCLDIVFCASASCALLKFCNFGKSVPLHWFFVFLYSCICTACFVLWFCIFVFPVLCTYHCHVPVCSLGHGAAPIVVNVPAFNSESS